MAVILSRMKHELLVDYSRGASTTGKLGKFSKLLKRRAWRGTFERESGEISKVEGRLLERITSYLNRASRGEVCFPRAWENFWMKL